ncbi:MAG: hypothetical protein CM1200mP16_07460 [Nitrospina sp.]|nr:MAG: hypothetical protein CM1200mP16_07460 [Nitrospina sp.]
MGNEKSRFLKRDDGTIYDSVTSVTWMANDSFLDLARDVSYSEAEDYVKETNKKKAGGYSDWRIPSIQEASSIFNKEKLNKDSKGGDIFLDSVFPPGAANCTWTSSTRGKEAQIMFTPMVVLIGTRKMIKPYHTRCASSAEIISC